MHYIYLLLSILFLSACNTENVNSTDNASGASGVSSIVLPSVKDLQLFKSNGKVGVAAKVFIFSQAINLDELQYLSDNLCKINDSKKRIIDFNDKDYCTLSIGDSVAKAMKLANNTTYYFAVRVFSDATEKDQDIIAETNLHEANSSCGYYKLETKSSTKVEVKLKACSVDTAEGNDVNSTGSGN